MQTVCFDVKLCVEVICFSLTQQHCFGAFGVGRFVCPTNDRQAVFGETCLKTVIIFDVFFYLVTLVEQKSMDLQCLLR